MRDWREIVRTQLANARLDPAREAEIVEELAQHLEDRYQALRARGIDDAEAERAVLDELSDAESLVLAIEDSAGAVGSAPTGAMSGAGNVFRDLWSDLHYAARTLRRSRWFAATAVLCLGLGIGATSLVFGVVDALFFRPPPGVGDPSGIVRPYLTMRSAQLGISGRAAGLPYPLYAEIHGQARSLEGMAGYLPVPVSVGLGPAARPADALLVVGGYFSVLRVQPALGRFFGADEPSPVAVISYAYWRSELGGDPDAIGTPLMLDGHAFTIIGVASERFHGIDFGTPSFWVPFSQSAELGRPINPFSVLAPVARLARGVTPAKAQAELEPLMRRALRADYGENTRVRLELGPIWAARGPYPSQQARVTRWLAIAAALVLAIACANTANLLLTRAVVRRKEIAIRLSMGASRIRLVRQLLTESALLAVCGAVLGLLLAHWGADLVPLGRLPPLSIFADGRVLLVAVAAALLCVAAFGTVPALAATRCTLGGTMKSSGLGRADGASTTRSALMVMQVALGTLLLVGAGLFVHGLRNLQTIDSGMDLEHLVTVSVDLRSAGYDGARAARFFERALAPLRRVPGVRAATIVSNPPLSGRAQTRPYSVPDSAAADKAPPSGPAQIVKRFVFATAVGPRYFAAVGTPMLAGRDFNEQDRADSTPVVIVNRTFAERDWPGKRALGQCIDIGTRKDLKGKCYRVIGVAADAKYQLLEEPRSPAFFVPLNQVPSPGLSQLLIRTAVPPAEIAGAVRNALAEIDPNLPYVDVEPLTAELRSRLEAPRLGASLFSAFGTLALVLAAIGLYGVVSYAVEQRRHEIGIRMALGAQTRNVLLLVVRQGMLLTLTGLAIGIVCSLGATHLIAHLLHGVGADDPLAFVTAAALFLAVGMVASFIPARCAARLDPAITLRNE